MIFFFSSYYNWTRFHTYPKLNHFIQIYVHWLKKMVRKAQTVFNGASEHNMLVLKVLQYIISYPQEICQMFQNTYFYFI